MTATIPLPTPRVRQLHVLCLFLAEVHDAVASGDRVVADQLLSTRVDMGNQARDAAAFLEDALKAGGHRHA